MQDKLIQLLVFGIAAGGVGAGLFTLINSGFKSEDSFAFAGAVGGAAATVAGAAWLADRSLTRERREEQLLIRKELLVLHQFATAAVASYPKEGGDWTDEWRSNMNSIVSAARDSVLFLDEVIATARTLDFHQRMAVKLVREAASFQLPTTLNREAITDRDVHEPSPPSPHDIISWWWVMTSRHISAEASYTVGVFGEGRS